MPCLSSRPSSSSGSTTGGVDVSDRMVVRGLVVLAGLVMVTRIAASSLPPELPVTPPRPTPQIIFVEVPSSLPTIGPSIPPSSVEPTASPSASGSPKPSPSKSPAPQSSAGTPSPSRSPDPSAPVTLTPAPSALPTPAIPVPTSTPLPSPSICYPSIPVNPRVPPLICDNNRLAKLCC